MIVVDNEKSKMKNKKRINGVRGYGDEEVEDEVEKRDLTGATASTSLYTLLSCIVSFFHSLIYFLFSIVTIYLKFF